LPFQFFHSFFSFCHLRPLSLLFFSGSSLPFLSHCPFFPPGSCPFSGRPPSFFFFFFFIRTDRLSLSLFFPVWRPTPFFFFGPPPSIPVSTKYPPLLLAGGYGDPSKLHPPSHLGWAKAPLFVGTTLPTHQFFFFEIENPLLIPRVPFLFPTPA